ncbi:hypothetical protein NP511_22465 (plasmid) [Natrinema thermotolerans]|uniref:Uncharacterized protein n=1 Tax=Natrinema thermotolerans TaxID=121872 RepID=A0AAF0PDX9_9EURY|nr:hypothetical protein [Natrinema thermotolerans]WMT10268.1 hypothetical protein NP511_22465 [Natrinema thermotolerans]
MKPKAYSKQLTWEFPSPNTPPLPNGDDTNLFVTPYGPLVV